MLPGFNLWVCHLLQYRRLLLAATLLGLAQALAQTADRLTRLTV
jgi:hypothetical protein